MLHHLHCSFTGDRRQPPGFWGTPCCRPDTRLAIGPDVRRRRRRILERPSTVQGGSTGRPTITLTTHTASGRQAADCGTSVLPFASSDCRAWVVKLLVTRLLVVPSIPWVVQFLVIRLLVISSISWVLKLLVTRLLVIASISWVFRLLVTRSLNISSVS